MSVPEWYFWLSIVGAFGTCCALLRVKHLFFLMPLYFFIAWLTGELAIFHIAWQMAASMLFIAAGALQSGYGYAGLVISALSWAGLYYFHRQGKVSSVVFEQALREGLGQNYRDLTPPLSRLPVPEQAQRQHWIRPFKMGREGVEVIRNIAYGGAGHRQHLDIYRPVDADVGARPVLLQVHGGGWMIGKKDQQGLPLMNYLASRGWICVAVNYQLSPAVKFPQHLIDIKLSMAWIREHIGEYGGDPDFVIVTGGSAGGHLSALLALTAGRRELQPGFEDVDTSVRACVPFYGVYDFLDRHQVRGVSSMTSFLEDKVMPVSPQQDPVLWDLASPIALVDESAPPFFVIAGTHDCMVFIEDTRHFVAALRNSSTQRVCYAELPLAQHAFDLFHSPRSDNAVFAVTRFVEHQYAEYLQGQEVQTRTA
jgi:acetyl esterase/lipase